MKITNNVKATETKILTFEKEEAEEAYLKVQITADEIPEAIMNKVRKSFETFWKRTAQTVTEEMQKADKESQSSRRQIAARK